MVIIVLAVLAVGFLAVWISRNVEHGEARFGPDGPLASYEEEERPALRVSIRSQRSEGSEAFNSADEQAGS